MPPPESTRPGWRDVLDISKELRDDLAEHRRESAESHRRINERLASLELADARHGGQRAGEKRVLGMAKSTLAILLAAASGAASVLGFLLPTH